MQQEDSQASWIRRLKAGDPQAAETLWERYFEQMVRFASRKLGPASRRSADEEDIALSAMKSFYAAVAAGRFPELDDRDQLRRLLMTVTARKAIRQLRHAHRQKRGGNLVRGESVFGRPGELQSACGIEQMAGKEPPAALASEMDEQFQHLLGRLGDQVLREVALLKLDGYSNEEIAEKLQCGLRTVERRLRTIRAVWAEEEVR